MYNVNEREKLAWHEFAKDECQSAEKKKNKINVN